MQFTSFAFLVFMPVVFALYWCARRHVGWQNALLLLASYVFYGWADARLLALVAAMTLVGYAAGRWATRQRWATGAGIAACLATLGVFKYFNFFTANILAALHTVGLGSSLPLRVWDIVLPAGISFYTFQLVAYMVDVRRGRVPACRDLVRFATFVAFFPQLVAGPIERAADLLPQLGRRRRLTPTEALTHGRPYRAAMLARGPLRLRPVRWVLYYGLLFALFYWGGEPTTFIYFQF